MRKIYVPIIVDASAQFERASKVAEREPVEYHAHAHKVPCNNTLTKERGTQHCWTS